MFRQRCQIAIRRRSAAAWLSASGRQPSASAIRWASVLGKVRPAALLLEITDGLIERPCRDVDARNVSAPLAKPAGHEHLNVVQRRPGLEHARIIDVVVDEEARLLGAVGAGDSASGIAPMPVLDGNHLPCGNDI